MNNTYNHIRKICQKQLDIPVHKIKYALSTGLLEGAFTSLIRYGIELNETTYDIFYDVVSEKLSGSSEVEYEWSEVEYEEIMKLKSYIKK